MWKLLSNSFRTSVSVEDLFSFEVLSRLTQKLERPIPVLKAHAWPGEENPSPFSLEFDSFPEFENALTLLKNEIDFLVYDEMRVDEELLYSLQLELQDLAKAEGIGDEYVSKVIAALRSYENECFSTIAFAFLKSNRIFFVRAQREISRYIYQPERLFVQDELSKIRKLHGTTETTSH